MSNDLLDEAEQRAAALATAQQGGRFPHLGVGGAAVFLLLLELMAEGFTEQDLRLQAAERERARAREDADHLRHQILSMQSAVAELRAIVGGSHPP